MVTAALVLNLSPNSFEEQKASDLAFGKTNAAFTLWLEILNLPSRFFQPQY